MNINRVTLLGTVSDEPTYREVGNTGVLKINICTVKHIVKKDGSEMNIRSFHKCEVWGKRAAELNDSVFKDDTLFVEGEIKYGSYENKEGRKVYTTDIAVGFNDNVVVFPSGGEIVQEAADDNPFN